MDEKKLPRRLSTSRNPTTNPRRIAGRPPRPEDRAGAGSPEQGGAPEPVEPAEPEEAREQVGESQSRPTTRPGILSRPRSTLVLGVLAGLLALVLIGMLAFVGLRGVDSGGDRSHVLPFDQDYRVADTPVQIPMADWQSANKAAAEAVTEMFTFTWKDYDKNVEAARKLITDRFEDEYTSTAEATRDSFVEAKADYAVKVVGLSVMEATPDEVASLLFVNQTVYKGEGEERTGPEIYQMRLRVRMVRTPSGWLIDEIQSN